MQQIILSHKSGAQNIRFTARVSVRKNYMLHKDT